MYRASGALFSTIETVAEENPLRSATSRIVTAADFLREASGTRRDFGVAAGFESESMISLNRRVWQADTTGRRVECQAVGKLTGENKSAPLHALHNLSFAKRMIARLGALIDALDNLVVRGQPAMFQPEKHIRFSAHWANIDNLLEAKVMRRHAGIHRVRQLNILLLISLNHRRGMNARRRAQRILAHHRIVRRNRHASRDRHGLTILLEFRQILLIPRRNAHQLEIDQHLIHRRVSDAFPNP